MIPEMRTLLIRTTVFIALIPTLFLHAQSFKVDSVEIISSECTTLEEVFGLGDFIYYTSYQTVNGYVTEKSVHALRAPSESPNLNIDLSRKFRNTFVSLGENGILHTYCGERPWNGWTLERLGADGKTHFKLRDIGWNETLNQVFIHPDGFILLGFYGPHYNRIQAMDLQGESLWERSWETHWIGKQLFGPDIKIGSGGEIWVFLKLAISVNGGEDFCNQQYDFRLFHLNPDGKILWDTTFIPSRHENRVEAFWFGEQPCEAQLYFAMREVQPGHWNQYCVAGAVLEDTLSNPAAFDSLRMYGYNIRLPFQIYAVSADHQMDTTSRDSLRMLEKGRAWKKNGKCGWLLKTNNSIQLVDKDFSMIQAIPVPESRAGRLVKLAADKFLVWRRTAVGAMVYFVEIAE